jgi:hypothetical protein
MPTRCFRQIINSGLYDVHGNRMDPFFIGLATAEFLPADPATWCDAAIAASVSFGRHKDSVVIGRDKEKGAALNFLPGWLYGTPGGEEALAAWMDGPGMKIAVLS